ncbi:MAG: sporulation protein [Paenibacillus sp.]|nr:sporulation protein [Paenibacillus sp.]
MKEFMSNLAIDFFVAFGIVLGACLLAGIGSVMTLQAPAYKMLDIAGRIKIWAMVAAVGGTIDPIRVIESNMLEGHLSPAFKQIMFFVSAFAGAHMGTVLVKWICQGSVES